MDAIRELLGRLNALTAEELADLRQKITEEFTTLDTEDLTPEVAASMNELAEASDQLMGEQGAREAAQQEANAAAEAAREKIAALNPPEPEAEAEAEPEGEPEPEPEGEQPAEAEAPAPEPVAASGARLQRMAARQGKATPGPEAEEAKPPARSTLVAAGSLSSMRPQGTEIATRRELGETMCEVLQKLHRQAPPKGNVLVASSMYEYPEDRQLTDDMNRNTEIILAACGPQGAGINPWSGEQVLVATGGICLPVNVDYAVPTWATADRPVRDALPAFQATRGGVRFVVPPDIGTWEAATSIWTEATDAAPGIETKPIVSMSCGSEELVFVEAIPTRIGFGNMQSRFAPEQVAANTDLAIAAAARVAENNLLNLIAAQCVKGVTAGTASQLGTTRELLSSMLPLLVSQQKQLHRLPDSQVFTLILPRWLRNEIRADLAREAAHQQGEWNSLSITDAQIDGLFEPYGVRPVWHYDGQTAAVEGGVSQIFEAPAKAAIKKFPAKFVGYFFPEGTIQFLDAGRLDLGVVRDSTLDATNDYETFVETFEGIAKRGYANSALQLIGTVESTGAAALGVDMKGKPPA